jgi:hypothetical protein
MERPAGERVYVGPSTSVEQAAEWSSRVRGGVGAVVRCLVFGVW